MRSLIMRFATGISIAWRNCVRLSPATGYEPSYACAMTVVHDRDGDLALYRGPGYPMRRRNAELASVPGFRHQPAVRHLDGWTVDPDWSRWHVVVLMDPRAHHAVSLFMDVATGALDFWYIDIIGPAQRRRAGFDFQENGLDIVMQPDFSSWRWKDEDELEWNVGAGRYTRTEADHLYAEGHRTVETLLRERGRFEAWRSWRPDPAWPIAVLPDGWDELGSAAVTSDRKTRSP